LARAMWALFIYLMRLECEIMIYHDLGLDVDDAFEQLFHTTESSFSVLAVLLELGKLLANGTGGVKSLGLPCEKLLNELCVKRGAGGTREGCGGCAVLLYGRGRSRCWLLGCRHSSCGSRRNGLVGLLGVGPCRTCRSLLFELLLEGRSRAAKHSRLTGRRPCYAAAARQARSLAGRRRRRRFRRLLVPAKKAMVILSLSFQVVSFGTLALKAHTNCCTLGRVETPKETDCGRLGTLVPLLMPPLGKGLTVTDMCGWAADVFRLGFRKALLKNAVARDSLSPSLCRPPPCFDPFMDRLAIAQCVVTKRAGSGQEDNTRTTGCVVNKKRNAACFPRFLLFFFFLRKNNLSC